ALGGEVDVAARQNSRAVSGPHAAKHLEISDDAVAAQISSAIDGYRTARLRTIHDQRAGAHGGLAGISIVASERPGAGAQFENIARADDQAAEGRRSAVCASPKRAIAQINDAPTVNCARGFVLVIHIQPPEGGDVNLCRVTDLIVASQPHDV